MSGGPKAKSGGARNALPNAGRVPLSDKSSASLAPPREPSELDRLPLFASLSKDLLGRAFDALEHLYVAATQAVDDRLLGRVWFVWTGTFRVTFLSPSGLHVSIRVVQPGEYFGDIAYLSGPRRRHFYALADTDGLLLGLPGTEFLALMQACETFRIAAIRNLAVVAAERADRLFEFAAFEVKLRLQAEIVRLSATARGTDAGLLIKPAPTHEAIATQIGTTREGVTRALRELASAGLLRVRRGEILILDIDRMRLNIFRAAGSHNAHDQDL